jgi:ABC-type dipeptide/oligopeptide/nickel transport system permease component
VLRYGVRRLVQAVPILFVISALTFATFRLVPGDAAVLLTGEDATPETLAAVRRQLGLDRPVLEQYGAYLAGLARGHLGTSIRTKRSVAQELVERVPATLELALAGGLLFTVAGLTLGTVAATAAGRWPDHLIGLLTTLGVSVPGFWLGAMLVLVLSVELQLLPVAGRGSPAFLVLPALTLSIPATALLARLVRASLLEALDEDYVRTARAKGLLEGAVVVRHALRAALVPVVTVTGLEFGRLIGGAIVIENLFAWPGFGRLLVNAIHARDYPVIQGAILVFSAALLAINVLADLLAGVVDPRVRQA